MCATCPENRERKGNLHGHIVSVNEAHEDASRAFKNIIPVEEEIVAVNEGNYKETNFQGTKILFFHVCTVGQLLRDTPKKKKFHRVSAEVLYHFKRHTLSPKVNLQSIPRTDSFLSLCNLFWKSRVQISPRKKIHCLVLGLTLISGTL